MGTRSSQPEIMTKIGIISLMVGSLGAVIWLGWVSWQGYILQPTPITISLPTPVTNDDPVVFAAGDISSCDNTYDTQTSDLLLSRSGSVLTLGDSVYPRGTIDEFHTCYDPTWGRVWDRTYPAPGNHDYATSQASGYYAYFGDRAGPDRRGYYRFQIGGWQIYALNSNCGEAGGCQPGDPQVDWLIHELATHPSRCAIAYFHHPRWSSALHGNNDVMQPIWSILARAGVDVVLSGHDHDYERFAPINADGQLQPNGGTRQFVVGTGGRSLYAFRDVGTGSEFRDNKHYGVLALTLHTASYSWEFLATDQTVVDHGTATCQ